MKLADMLKSSRNIDLNIGADRRKVIAAALSDPNVSIGQANQEAGQANQEAGIQARLLGYFASSELADKPSVADATEALGVKVSGAEIIKAWATYTPG